MPIVRTPCEGKCCCQCSYCAGKGYFTQWDVSLAFSGTFISAPTNPYDTSGGVGTPTVGTCTCTAMTFTKRISMLTSLDGVTGGLDEGPDPDTLEHLQHSCCRWELVQPYDHTNAPDDCGTGRFVNLNPAFDCSNFLPNATGINVGLRLCGNKKTSGETIPVAGEYPFGASGGIFGEIKVQKVHIPASVLLGTPAVDCDDDTLVPLLSIGGDITDAGTFYKSASGFNCLTGYTFSGSDIYSGGKIFFPFGGLGGKTFSGCSVSSVTFTPVAGSWRQCGQNDDGSTFDPGIGVGRAGSAAASASKTELPLARPDRCEFLGKRKDFVTGCNGWKCGHGCTLGLPAVPGEYCQKTCQSYAVDEEYLGKGVEGWLA